MQWNMMWGVMEKSKSDVRIGTQTVTHDVGRGKGAKGDDWWFVTRMRIRTGSGLKEEKRCSYWRYACVREVEKRMSAGIAVHQHVREPIL